MYRKIHSIQIGLSIWSFRHPLDILKCISHRKRGLVYTFSLSAHGFTQSTNIRHHAKNFVLYHFILTMTPQYRYYYYFFREEETNAQRVYITCSVSHTVHIQIQAGRFYFLVELMFLICKVIHNFIEYLSTFSYVIMSSSNG